MDGFNVIPVDRTNSYKSVAPTKPVISSIPSIPTPYPSRNTSGGMSNQDIYKSDIQIVDESENVRRSESGNALLSVLSVFSLLGVIGYFGFLLFTRFNALSQIVVYGQELQDLSKNINKKELESFRGMDTTLKTINAKLANHVLNSQILIYVNNNLRNTLQISEYKIDVKEKEVEVYITSLAPSMKEVAEQTEKILDLKAEGGVKNFSVSNISFESDTRRLRFTTKLTFDKSKVSALAVPNTESNVDKNISQN